MGLYHLLWLKFSLVSVIFFITFEIFAFLLSVCYFNLILNAKLLKFAADSLESETIFRIRNIEGITCILRFPLYILFFIFKISLLTNFLTMSALTFILKKFCCKVGYLSFIYLSLIFPFVVEIFTLFYFILYKSESFFVCSKLFFIFLDLDFSKWY